MDKVVNPKTGKLIKINGPTFNKLIEEGYTKNELMEKDLEQLDEELPFDILYNILIQSNINQIQNLCYTNKYLHQICNQTSFWELIHERDRLPLLTEWDNIADWINDYHKMKKINQKVTIILDYLVDYHRIRLFGGNKLNDWIKKFAPQLPGARFYIDVYYVEPNNIIIYSDVNKANLVTFNLNEFETILVQTFYYYPQVKVTTVNNVNILPEKRMIDEGGIAKNVKRRQRNKIDLK